MLDLMSSEGAVYVVAAVRLDTKDGGEVQPFDAMRRKMTGSPERFDPWDDCQVITLDIPGYSQNLEANVVSERERTLEP